MSEFLSFSIESSVNGEEKSTLKSLTRKPIWSDFKIQIQIQIPLPHKSQKETERDY
jgi:hypothetical protein